MKGKSLYLAIRAAATVSAMLGTLVMPAAMHAAARSGDNDNSSGHAWTAGYSESNWSNTPNGFGFNASSDEDVDHSEDADNNSDTDADENADDPGDDQQGDDQGATGADNGGDDQGDDQGTDEDNNNDQGGSGDQAATRPWRWRPPRWWRLRRR